MFVAKIANREPKYIDKSSVAYTGDEVFDLVTICKTQISLTQTIISLLPSLPSANNSGFLAGE